MSRPAPGPRRPARLCRPARRRPSASPRRRLGAVLVVIVVLALAVLGRASTAWAHAELVDTEPSSGAELEAAPSEVVLRFTEGVDPVPGGIRVVDSGGVRVDEGEVGTVDGDDSTVRLTLPDDLAEDTYVVAWRVTSADSHPVRGAFTFVVGTDGGADVGPLVDRLLADQSGSRAAGALLAVGRWASYAGVVLVVGWLSFALLGLAHAARPVPYRPVRLAAGLGAAGTVAMIAAQAVALRGGWSAALTPAAWADVFDTRSGRWWLARLVVLAVLAVGARAITRPAPRSAWTAAAAALALTVVTTFGGHGGTGRWPVAGVAATVVHLGALGIWAAGLVSLAVPALRRQLPDGAIGRFSDRAVLAVVALVASGALNSVRQVGEVGLLRSTDYGRLLTTKVVVVAAVLLVALASRRAVRAATADPAADAATADAATAATADAATAGVAVRPVRAEVALVAVALVVTAVLVNVRPAISERNEPATAFAVVERRTAQIVLDPARTGGAALHVYLTSPNGSLDRASEISVTATLPAQDIGPLQLQVFEAGPNHVTNPNIELPLPGVWTIEVAARYGQFEEVRFSAALTVRS